MKKLNSKDYEILKKIYYGDKTTRSDIENEFKISPAAISKTIKKFKEMNIVKENKVFLLDEGRSKKIININKDYKKIIGVNFSKNFIEITIANINGEILETKRKTTYSNFKIKFLEKLKKEIELFINKYGKENILGIGLIGNGIVDSKNGIFSSLDIIDFKSFKLEEYLKDIFSLPVIIENDSRAMLKAEIFFNKEIYKFDNSVFIDIKDNVKLTFMINGKIFEGDNFFSGNIKEFSKHFLLLKNKKTDELILENIKDNILKFINESDESKISIYDILEKVKIKEEPYYTKMNEIIENIRIFLENILILLGINNIIVSGDYFYLNDACFNKFKKELIKKTNPNLKVYRSKLGKDIEKYASIATILTNAFSEKLKSNKKE